MTNFAYIGRGLTLDQFAAYVRDYDFGAYPPTFTVLHHTVEPDVSWAKLNDGTWDLGDDVHTDVYAKRLRMLGNIRTYYRDHLGWDAGPHLFIDDQWIWLFTPMNQPGIHATAGNGSRTSFSIGIEVVGYYEKVKWPKPVEVLVGGAIGYLQQRLGTFQLEYKVGPGGMSSHRDWGKPACPGKAITNSYYVKTIQREAALLPMAPSCKIRYMSLGNGLRVRQQPTTTAVIMGSLLFHQVVDVVTEVQGESVLGDTRWGKLTNGGYVSLRYMAPRP